MPPDLSSVTFQFTPLREGRPFPLRLQCGASLFQFTPLREGRLAAEAATVRPYYFNSRPSARGDTMGILGAMHGKFQFTPLREGRPTSAVRRTPSSNFNSRPSARGDFNGALTSATVSTISIHAPPRGATRYQRRWNPAIRFQFTPLREGRHDGERVRFAAWRYFNSRPSARGDARTGVDLTLMHFISIHAPPRGATQWRTQTGRKLSFQFTPLREGRRGWRRIWRRSTTSFQFTLLREGRHNRQSHRETGQPISIHAPPRGGTMQNE